MIKTLQKMGTEGTYLNIVKAIPEIHTAEPRADFNVHFQRGAVNCNVYVMKVSAIPVESGFPYQVSQGKRGDFPQVHSHPVILVEIQQE